MDSRDQANDEPRTSDIENVDTEASPLLKDKDQWRPPRGFYWIQAAIFSNVFLSGFDSTITASTYARIGSDFNSANVASWLTTSYLITATAFQPLYARFSDIFGRRAAFFTCTSVFIIGSIGCASAPTTVTFNIMRAVQGMGGAGLVTMATIINSDMIPFKQRGMYQAAQNVLHGFGTICGASLGGVVADSIGWRWCFALQTPISAWALTLGYYVIMNPSDGLGAPVKDSGRQLWAKVDFSGALFLILGLAAQLVGLSLGGNDLPWSDIRVILSLVGSAVLILIFLVIEAKTSAIPIVPLRLFRGIGPIAAQISNVLLGISSYGFLFMIPLYFQVVLGESAAKAGARLIIPSVAQPIGGVIAGTVMSRFGKLKILVLIGAALQVLGNGLVGSFKFQDASWKYLVYLFPANLGQGISNPSLLFTFMSAFDHSDHSVTTSTVYLTRSIGWVWGVAITSAITQNTLTARLPDALSGIPDKWTVIDKIRHSVSAISELPIDVQIKARIIYYEGIQMAFMASVCFAGVATVAGLFTRGQGLNRDAA